MRGLVYAALLLFFLPGLALASDRVLAVQPFPATANERVLKDPYLWMESYSQAVQAVRAINAKGLLMIESWSEVEPRVGAYDQEKISRDLKLNHIGTFDQVLLGMQIINTVKREVPKNLRKKAWDDPAMIGAFRDYINWLAPQIAGQVDMISIANETDVYFKDHPDELDAFLVFQKQALDHIRIALPGVKVGVTVTFEGLENGRAPLLESLTRDSDMVIMTYYPFGKDGRFRPADAPLTDFPRMVEFAGTKKLILQEVGYPTAASVGGSEEVQAAFVTSVFQAWSQSADAIPFLSFFMQHDFAPQTCGALSGYYGVGAEGIIHDMLCTLGLRYVDGRPKKAWPVLVESAKALP